MITNFEKMTFTIVTSHIIKNICLDFKLSFIRCFKLELKPNSD